MFHLSVAFKVLLAANQINERNWIVSETNIVGGAFNFKRSLNMAVQ